MRHSVVGHVNVTISLLFRYFTCNRRLLATCLIHTTCQAARNTNVQSLGNRSSYVSAGRNSLSGYRFSAGCNCLPSSTQVTWLAPRPGSCRFMTCQKRVILANLGSPEATPDSTSPLHIPSATPSCSLHVAEPRRSRLPLHLRLASTTSPCLPQLSSRFRNRPTSSAYHPHTTRRRI